MKLVRLDSRFLAVSPTAYAFMATPKESTLGNPHSLGVLELEKRKNPKMHRRKNCKLVAIVLRKSGLPTYLSLGA